jgi:hypothetical protein
VKPHQRVPTLSIVQVARRLQIKVHLLSTILQMIHLFKHQQLQILVQMKPKIARPCPRLRFPQRQQIQVNLNKRVPKPLKTKLARHHQHNPIKVLSLHPSHHQQTILHLLPLLIILWIALRRVNALLILKIKTALI